MEEVGLHHYQDQLAILRSKVDFAYFMAHVAQ